MEENVVASLWSLVADLGEKFMVVNGVGEIQPNDCAGSRSTANTDIFLRMMRCLEIGDIVMMQPSDNGYRSSYIPTWML